jgi:hypothetical protein
MTILVNFPALKRGASQHCASGAIESGTSLGQQLGFMRLPWA